MKQRRLLVWVALFLGFGIAVAGCAPGRVLQPLSDARIRELRATYPTVSVKAPIVDIIQRPPSDIARECSSYVIAEVTEGRTDSSLLIGYPDEQTKEKWQGIGIPPMTAEYADFSIRIREVLFSRDVIDLGPELTIRIRDGAQVRQGQELTVSMITHFDQEVPDLKPGMILVLPVRGPTEDDLSSRNFFLTMGLYYVVDDHYVLSAFQELPDAQYSGMPLDQFKALISQWGADNG